jgi:hypothetical protein
MAPELEEINYYLGLLFVKLEDPVEACIYFKKSRDLGENSGADAVDIYCP